MKQVEEEYYKTDEKSPNVPNGSANPTGSPTELYARSPDQPLSSLPQGIPEPVKTAVNSIIKSQKIIERTVPNYASALTPTTLAQNPPT